MHEIAISFRFPDLGENGMPKFIGETEYMTDIEFIHKDSLKEMNAVETLVTISDLIVPPRAEVMITYGVGKSLMQFEQYTNDPSRGFNIQHMPVLYREMEKHTNTDDEENKTFYFEVAGDGEYDMIYSEALLV